MNKKIILAFILLVIIVVAIFLLLKKKAAAAGNAGTNQAGAATGTNTGKAVDYNNSGLPVDVDGNVVSGNPLLSLDSYSAGGTISVSDANNIFDSFTAVGQGQAAASASMVNYVHSFGLSVPPGI